MRGKRVLLLAVLALAVAVPGAWATTSQRSSGEQRPGSGSSAAKVRRGVTPIPPIGLPIDTISGSDGSVRIGDKSYGSGPLRLIVVNRESLDVQAFPFANDASGIAALRSKADQFDEHWLDIVTAPNGLDVTSDGAKAFNDKVVTAIGGAPLDGDMLKAKTPVSVVGVLGWSPGTAYENLGRTQVGSSRSGALVGYLQRNPASQAVGFVFGDYPSFNTRADSSPNSVTMEVAGRRYAFDIPRGSGFALAVFHRGDLALRLERTFATDTRDPKGDEIDERYMGEILRAWRNPSYLIIVQSIGSPRPNTPGWNDLANGIADVGGTRGLINGLNGESGYSLVTVPGIAGDDVESVNDRVTRQDGSIMGVLALDHTDGFAPLLTDPAGKPTLNDLLQLAYRPASPWPDRDTTGRRAAISYIAHQLGLPVDDPRLEYTNLTIHFGDDAYSGKLERMTYPGGSVQFSAEDFATVKSELLKEFLWVTKVRAYTDEIRRVMDESIVIKEGVLSGVAETIKSKSGLGNRDTRVNAFQIVADLFGLAKTVSPDPASQAVATAVSTVFRIAGTLTKSNGSDVLGTFTTTTNTLAHDLVSRYDEGLSSLGLMRSILVTDYDKLETAGTNIIDEKPGWVWNDATTASTLRDMTLAAKRVINEALLPVVYVTYHLPGEFQDPASCRVLRGEPSSAWISHINGFVGSPGDVHPDTQAFAVGLRDGEDVYGGFKANADLFDPLFKEVSPDSTDRLGLSKVYFLSRIMGQANLGSGFCWPH